MKKYAYSILELALVPEGNSIQQTLHQSLLFAKEAEKYDYKRFWLAEHHNSEYIGSTATSILIGYIAAATHTIRVGSGGVMLPNHSPLVVAEQFGTLAHLYPRRIDLGLGRAPGTDPETAHAIRSDFFQAAQAFPAEVERVQRYFSTENRQSKVRAPIAEGTDVPLYILGSSTDSAHLAAQKGLPYAFASHFATAQLFQALSIYMNEFQPSELLPAPYTMVGINVFVADTDEEGERLFTTLIRMFIGVLTGKPQPVQPPGELTHELREIMHHPTVNQMLKYSFYGSKETVKQQVQAFLETTQVDELIITTTTYALEDRMKSIRLFAEIMKDISG